MTYFRILPNLEYQSFLSDKKSSEDYLIVKNLFRRVKLRDDLKKVFVAFDKYQIVDGARPENVAQELYGSVQYDWVVLISAEITRVRDQWPLSDKDLYDYAESIYGENLNDIHHYETIEVKDSEGRLILPAGKVVDADFTISYLDGGKIYSNNPSAQNYTNVSSTNSVAGTQTINILTSISPVSPGDTFINGNENLIVSQVNIGSGISTVVLSSSISSPITAGNILNFKRYNATIIQNPVVGITNYEYEVKKNNEKRTIYVLKPIYLQQALNDAKREMTYDQSSQYVNDNLIKTENTRASNPQ
jgi:hypothetical protein